ncbi:MAG: hydroxysqualene dehydroxylase HpnE [Methylophilaceae bacterium]
MLNTKNNVAIIGGGVAGLAAAAKLAEKGLQTTLFEAGSQLGGRARSLAIEFNSQIVQLDNGQHILLGAYRETLKLLDQIGIREEQAFLRTPLMLESLAPSGKLAFRFSALAYLPHPFNLLIGFCCCKGLSVGERFSVVRLMVKMRRCDYQIAADEPLQYYLEKQRQSAQVIHLLWEPLCLSAMNTPIQTASSKVFLNILKDAFSHQKSNSDLLLPKLDLSQILSQPITRYLQARQGKLLTNHRVKAIKPSANGFSVTTKKGESEFSHVIIATSAVRFKNIVADLPKLSNIAETTESYEHQPIVTIYLQYPNHIKLPKPMMGLTSATGQWIFDRGTLCGQHGLMAVIISTEGKHQKLTHEALALKVARELSQTFPVLKKPLWHQVIAEKRATFSCNVSLPRPANSTLYPNLFIAGDYTYADYPATIEGAVRSGVSAANQLINSF